MWAQIRDLTRITALNRRDNPNICEIGLPQRSGYFAASNLHPAAPRYMCQSQLPWHCSDGPCFVTPFDTATTATKSR